MSERLLAQVALTLGIGKPLAGTCFPRSHREVDHLIKEKVDADSIVMQDVAPHRVLTGDQLSPVLVSGSFFWISISDFAKLVFKQIGYGARLNVLLKAALFFSATARQGSLAQGTFLPPLHTDFF